MNRKLQTVVDAETSTQKVTVPKEAKYHNDFMKPENRYCYTISYAKPIKRLTFNREGEV